MSAAVTAFRVLRIVASGVFSLPVLVASARADDAPVVVSPGTSVDKPRAETSATHTVDRAWLYLDDAKTADPGSVIAMTGVSFTSVPTNPDPTSAPYRAFAFNTAQPGALVSLGGEVGVLPRLSLIALGQAELGGQGSAVSPGATAGVRLQLSPSTWRNVHVLVSGGYLRETWSAPVRDPIDHQLGPGQPNGDNGAWMEAALSTDLHRLRLGLTTHGEHVFADGRDGVDVMVKAGASYRFADWFRAGVEWVGQDLEESVKASAEGGARNFVGPTAAVHLLQDRLTVVAGPSVGLSDRSPKLLARLAVAYGF